MSENPSNKTNRCNSTSLKEINFNLHFNQWSAVRTGGDHPMKIFDSQALCINCFKIMVTSDNQPNWSKIFKFTELLSFGQNLCFKVFFSIWETLKKKRSSLCCQTIPIVFIVRSLPMYPKLSFASRYSGGRSKILLDSFEVHLRSSNLHRLRVSTNCFQSI